MAKQEHNNHQLQVPLVDCETRVKYFTVFLQYTLCSNNSSVFVFKIGKLRLVLKQVNPKHLIPSVEEQPRVFG